MVFIEAEKVNDQSISGNLFKPEFSSKAFLVDHNILLDTQN
jgi:hypothetical protein